jgi:antitoxin CcdA
MKALTYDSSAPRRAANLSVNADLLRIARRLRVNLSRELERRLAEIVAQHRRARWLEENRDAIDSYNAHVERHGVFSDGLRSF